MSPSHAKRIQLSAVIDADLRIEFEVACVRRRISLKNGIEEALRDWCRKEEMRGVKRKA